MGSLFMGYVCSDLIHIGKRNLRSLSILAPEAHILMSTEDENPSDESVLLQI